jgi:hypothetical protein
MEPLSYMRSVIDQNIVMRRIPVIGACVLNALLLEELLNSLLYLDFDWMDCPAHASYSSPMRYK